METSRWNLSRSDPALIASRFEDIGAQAVVRLESALHSEVRLDIKPTPTGEVFDIRVGARAGLYVADVDQPLRQVLLSTQPRSLSPRHYLCGRDERHWFVASVPARRGPVTSVAAAFESLKPDAVLASQRDTRIPDDQKLVRSNDAYTRQGEWFFVPRPKMVVPYDQILRREPIQRVGGKPHWLEFAWRERGGQSLWVSDQHPAGLTRSQYKHLLKDDPGASLYNWRRMHAGARLFAKGRVTHPDHKPAYLHRWHEVYLSTEHEAADGSVRFLD